MNDRNSRNALHGWVDQTLDREKMIEGVSPLTSAEKRQLRETGHAMACQGQLRGDISEKWREMVPRINMAMMDLYL